MNDPRDAAKQKAEDAYNAAADHFDSEPMSFLTRCGRRTVDKLSLKPAAHVLDVCCGSGASALPAAEAVGPKGSVLAVDLAENLLELGRAKARAGGLRSLEFRRADMTALDFPDGRFDAVICGFGIFFVPDMEKQVAELWRLVAPGGRLAITTWGPDLFAPAYACWREALRRARPDLDTAFNPWDRITTPNALRKLFADAGIARVEVDAEEGYQPLRKPEDFWNIVLGSGLRWTVDRLGAETAASVRREVVEKLTALRADRVATNVLYAIARRGTAS